MIPTPTTFNDAHPLPNKVVSGLKRSFEAVLASEVSLFGETSGVLQIQHGCEVDCGVICSGWPTFVFGAVARGWNVQFICLKNNEWSDLINNWFPNSTVLIVDDNFNPSIVQQGVSIWFSDIDPPRILQVWNSDALVIITQRRARHIQGREWCMRPITIMHAQCGGVTDGKWVLNLYYKASFTDFPLTECAVSGRNLHSLLDSMSSGCPCTSPPKIDLTATPIVVRQRCSTYHCDGLLPWTDRDAFVTSPSVFSPTRWVRRRLTTRELLHVLDVPDSVIPALSDRSQRTLSRDTASLPLKIVLQLLNMLPIPMFARTSASKRRCLPKALLVIDSTSSVSGPIGIGPTTNLCDGPASSPNPNPQNESERNQKATKSDDAPVPEYLWDRSIVDDDDPRRAEKLSFLVHFRQFALRWWKRHLTRDFLRWFRHTHSKNLSSFAARRDRLAGLECIIRGANSTWWEWKDGSRPFFWRWPSYYQATIRDGLRLWCHGSLPKWRVPQRHEPDPELRERMRLSPGPIWATSILGICS